MLDEAKTSASKALRLGFLLLASAGLCCILTAVPSTDLAGERPLHRRLSSKQPQRALDYDSVSSYGGFGQGVISNENQGTPISGQKPRFVIHMGPMKTGTSSL